MPPIRRAALVFIFVTVVLDVLAFGVIIPVLPKLIEEFTGGDTAHAARIFGLFGAMWALMQFVFSQFSARYQTISDVVASSCSPASDSASTTC